MPDHHITGVGALERRVANAERLPVSSQLREWLKRDLQAGLQQAKLALLIALCAIDEQLWELMADDTFSALKTITMPRGSPFKLDTQDLGWKHLCSNQFWQILQRAGGL